MARMTKAQYRAYAEQWRKTGAELERVHTAELRRRRYDPCDADALLELGDHYQGPPRTTSGLVEMQKWFMKLAEKQGLLPARARVREEGAGYAANPGAAGKLSLMGNAGILKNRKVALLCSSKCPGKLADETYDLVQKLRDAGVTVISGFHSPMEKECLKILLRSPHPVVWCLARGMVKAVPRELRRALKEDRLLIVSPFPASERRVTVETARTRNRVVAGLAEAVIVPHASPGSKMEALCREVLSSGKALHTFNDPANEALLRLGARAITPETRWADPASAP
jgi:hypothetical protein